MAKFYQFPSGEIGIVTSEGSEYLEGAALITSRYGHENVVLTDPAFIQVEGRKEMILVSAGTYDRLEVARRLKDKMVDPANFPDQRERAELQNDLILGIAHALGVLNEVAELAYPDSQ